MTENQPLSPKSLAPTRCVWQVRAGVIPGSPIPELTREFFMTSAEFESDRGKEIFLSRSLEVAQYALLLQDPNRFNWVRVEWVWF